MNVIKNKLHGTIGALLVDSAHGAHFTFSSKLPQDAGTWADLWVSGAHKTLPAPTQTAFLHAADERNVADVARMLRGITTTSPSWMLLAGLDNGRAMMQQCDAMLDELIDNCLGFSERINKLDGLRCWTNDDVRTMGYCSLDPTRLVVDVSGLGLTGWEASARLREIGIQAEMCDLHRVVMIATIMDGGDRLQQLYKAFERLAAVRKPKQPINETAAPPMAGEAVMTLRQAWLSRAQAVPMGQAEGRIAAEPFGAYPPGIPLCMPGERISRIALDIIEHAKALGGNFIGVREGMVCVVED
jgi:arginine decarboxylase